MQLTPREKDKLLVAMAAEVARKRLARGVQLNYPELSPLFLTLLLKGHAMGALLRI
jgi:urease subunit gamma